MSDNNAMAGYENVDYKNVYQLNVSSRQCCACFSNNRVQITAFILVRITYVSFVELKLVSCEKWSNKI
jgi:hypothetical protein